MRVFDKTKTTELTDYDLEKGYLRDDVLETEIPEQQAVEEKFHYETVREYPNGGKDVEKVIDVEGKPYVPAHTEREDIYVDVPYTDDEIDRMSAIKEIAELKANLRETDYKAIKFAEGLISEADYAEVKAQRQAWRDRINELEAKI